MREKFGFTIIELLVVITIIGVLVSIVLAALGNARDRAKLASAKSDLHQIIEAAISAQGENGTVLMYVTGNNCTFCTPDQACGNGKDLRNIPETNNCYSNWISSLARIQEKSLVYQGIDRFKRDPWGSPYLLDENEREGDASGAGPDCRFDEIGTAGPDGVMSTSDDLFYQIPHAFACP